MKSDGVHKMMFTHYYDENINLIKELDSLLINDPLARELAGKRVINLSRNLETLRKEAQRSREKKDWDKLTDILRKENFKVASFIALVRKAHAVEKKVLSEGGDRRDVIRQFERMADDADELKIKFSFIDPTPDSEHKNAYYTQFDNEYNQLKLRHMEELGKAGIDPTPYSEWLDIYMLSPFVRKHTERLPDNVRSKWARWGMPNRIPWQSSQVDNKAIKLIFDEMDVVHVLAQKPVVKQVDKLSGLKEYLHRPSGYSKINESFTKFMGEEFVSDPQFDKDVKKLKDLSLIHI